MSVCINLFVICFCCIIHPVANRTTNDVVRLLGAERAAMNGAQDAREFLVRQCVDSLKVYRYVVFFAMLHLALVLLYFAI